MDMLCPECLSRLQAAPGGTVRCPAQGIEFRILFTRVGAVVPVRPAVSATGMVANDLSSSTTEVCRFHPTKDAVCKCLHCENAICEVCRFTGGLCPECAAAGLGGAIAHDYVPRALPVIPDGTMCRTHGGAPAVQHCHACRAPMCATCDFVFPGDVHLCPKCATQTQPAMSPKRKSMVSWSIALAVFGTLGTMATIAIFSGAFGTLGTEEDLKVLDLVLTNVIRLSTLIGMGLGFASLDKRLGNPAIVWVGVVWNTVLLSLWMILIAVGMLFGG